MDIFFRCVAAVVVSLAFVVGLIFRTVIKTPRYVTSAIQRTVRKWSSNRTPTVSTQKVVQPAFSALPEQAASIPEIADEYQLIVFNQSFNASLGIYKKSGRVKRVIRPTTAAAEQLLKQRYNLTRWNLADMTTSSSLSLEDVFLFTEEEGNNAIQEFLKADGPQFQSQIQRLRATMDRNAALISAVVPAEVGDRAVVALNGGAATAVATAPVAVAEQVASTVPVVAPVAEVVRAKKPDRSKMADIKGTVIAAEKRDMGEFATFEAAIRSDEDGQSASFRGVRLQEIFQEQNIGVGDRVHLVSLEPTKVDGSAKTRNEYQVTVLERAAVAA